MASPTPQLSIAVYTSIPGIKDFLSKRDGAVFQQCTFVFCDGPLSDQTLEIFREAEIVLIDTERLPHLIPIIGNAKWVQTTRTGTESLMKHIDKTRLPPKFALTRFLGVFGPHMAELVIGHIIAHERHFKELAESQTRKEWTWEGYTHTGYRLLRGMTVSVLALGEAGQEIGRACKAFNMRVIGLRRDLSTDQLCDGFDECRTLDDLPYMMAEADFIVNALPRTKDGVIRISGDTLSHCRKKPAFINVGRGDFISQEDIITAIREGWVSHAILDVTDPEPLPKYSPLWAMPEVTITPRISALSHGYEVVDLFLANYERYIRAQPLKHQLDWSQFNSSSPNEQTYCRL